LQALHALPAPKPFSSGGLEGRALLRFFYACPGQIKDFFSRAPPGSAKQEKSNFGMH
jgi:hypothetical protein